MNKEKELLQVIRHVSNCGAPGVMEEPFVLIKHVDNLYTVFGSIPAGVGGWYQAVTLKLDGEEVRCLDDERAKKYMLPLMQKEELFEEVYLLNEDKLNDILPGCVALINEYEIPVIRSGHMVTNLRALPLAMEERNYTDIGIFIHAPDGTRSGFGTCEYEELRYFSIKENDGNLHDIQEKERDPGESLDYLIELIRYLYQNDSSMNFDGSIIFILDKDSIAKSFGGLFNGCSEVFYGGNGEPVMVGPDDLSMR